MISPRLHPDSGEDVVMSDDIGGSIHQSENQRREDSGTVLSSY